ncbi:FtsQ-type POTRA domain-containing protein [Parvimonas micra]|uniref:cell division protein FtsQ/DivIB n=1 Tax=Parvimonas micra TaxID=33033 RepID=UPI001E383FB3|nr:FtsQ-type POTRA domain-containing protein [Parvimonas micra]MCE3020382.1 FtsQ-type POTRA domain-containing protein [Parvimonas micra]
MSGNNGKKPKIFVKKRSDEVSSEHDEFYEYDNLKSKSYTIDESFFEDFESVDFDKKNYEKENTSSEETKNEVLISEEILEDEVFQEIPDEIDAKEENEVEIVNEKEEEILKDISESKEFESKEEYEEVLDEDDDDDFGSLESEEDIVPNVESELDKQAEEGKNDNLQSNNIQEENILEETQQIKVQPEDKFGDGVENSEIPIVDGNEEDSIFNRYSIANNELSSNEGNYDSLFEKNQEIIENNELVEEDDDDFGSLDEVDTTMTQAFVNVNQKPDYYEDLKDTTDEFSFDEEDEEDEYYIDKKGNKKKKRRGFRLFCKFLLVFLLACFAISVYFGLTHDLFKIDYINVVGNVANEKEILISKSGVNIGDNIFLVSTSKIKKNLKELSNIESVNVKKNFPNILEIEVKENYVSAYINTASGLTTIDNYGKVKEVATDNSKASGIQLKGIPGTGLKVGENFSDDEDKVKFLLDIITKEYYFDIVSIDFTNDSEIVLEFKNSFKVIFGDLKDYAKKTQIIGILIKKIQLEGINAKEIILNVGDNPIIVKK